MDEQKIKLFNEARINISDFSFCLGLQYRLAWHRVLGDVCGLPWTDKASISASWRCAGLDSYRLACLFPASCSGLRVGWLTLVVMGIFTPW